MSPNRCPPCLRHKHLPLREGRQKPLARSGSGFRGGVATPSRAPPDVAPPPRIRCRASPIELGFCRVRQSMSPKSEKSDLGANVGPPARGGLASSLLLRNQSSAKAEVLVPSRHEEPITCPSMSFRHI